MVRDLSRQGPDFSWTTRATNENLCDAPVQQAAARQASLFIHKRAQLFMAEVIDQCTFSCSTSDFFYQSFSKQFFQRDDCLFFTASTGFTQNIKVKRAPNHRCCIQQLPARLTDVNQA